MKFRWIRYIAERLPKEIRERRKTAVSYTHLDVYKRQAQIVDEKLSSLNETTFEWRDSKAGFWKNMKKNSYIGCCMAVRRSALKRILPIPDNIWIHDQWIGLLAEQLGKVVFIEEPLIYYRRHGGNVTELTHGSITSMIKKRYHMIMEINRRVKEWSEHDKQNQRHIEKP